MARRTKKDKIRFNHKVQQCARNAYSHGQKWTDDDVAIIMQGIYNDESTYELAMRLGRTYWATAAARTHTRWAMDHSQVIYVEAKRPARLKRVK